MSYYKTPSDGQFILLLIFAGLVIIFGPVLLIWSLNTLFALAIPFTLETWFAAAILGMLIGRNTTNDNS